ncbi:isopentenyl-diphosphate delta isomerase isoform X1 [Brevipalpus obovatus]|uniref:isopentenyl-diphosphate delta isomerase isoform X1 n=1 Tax=Brevipalpus obovatus TaxID=246614 RepID=UPI003D9F8FA9
MIVLRATGRLFSPPLLTRALDSLKMSSSLINTNGGHTIATNNNTVSIHQQEALMNEMCIIVNEQDLATGSRTKRDCHLMDNINKGLLHRAFSVLLFNKQDQFLLTRRASSKVTFPNYYTNACCSHPLFTELEKEEKDGLGVRRAAQRKLFQELGIDPNTIPIDDIKYITRILYKSPSSKLWGEHELDYILIVHRDVDLKPNPDEVSEAVFLKKDELRSYMEEKEKEGYPISPWFKLIHDKFLYGYWDNLTKLDQFVDHKTIHKLI